MQIWGNILQVCAVDFELNDFENLQKQKGLFDRGCSSVVERMLRMYEVLGSIPNISKHLLLFNDFHENLSKIISLMSW